MKTWSSVPREVLDNMMWSSDREPVSIKDTLLFEPWLVSSWNVARLCDGGVALYLLRVLGRALSIEL